MMLNESGYIPSYYLVDALNYTPIYYIDETKRHIKFEFVLVDNSVDPNTQTFLEEIKEIEVKNCTKSDFNSSELIE